MEDCPYGHAIEGGIELSSIIKQENYNKNSAYTGSCVLLFVSIECGSEVAEHCEMIIITKQNESSSTNDIIVFGKYFYFNFKNNYDSYDSFFESSK